MSFPVVEEQLNSSTKGLWAEYDQDGLGRQECRTDLSVNFNCDILVTG